MDYIELDTPIWYYIINQNAETGTSTHQKND